LLDVHPSFPYFQGMSACRFLKTDVRLPPAQLNHMEIRLDFRDAWVDGDATLTLTAREPLHALALDAQELQIFGVTRPEDGAALAFRVDAGLNKLVVELGREVRPGETFRLRTRTRCVPSQTHLEGLYYDVAPAGAPPQILSQCQQWGFQRILPVIDDCTAKCTFRTTLEADCRYTHLISNGNVDRDANPAGRPLPLPGDPSRQTITYVNDAPMAPYLFLACVGTWEVLADAVVLPAGRTVRLEYLVPPGRAADAAVPMAILQDSVLWQHRTQGYTYRHDCYRTICMEKSNYGGMENVGNTTILTEAALIDAWTSDSRLIYAHGVIVHEFEHNQCGSDVTMASPFDMWLNEAFTVDVERQYLRSVFSPDFLRLREVDAMRAPGGGPLATEDGGQFGRIVREGFNDPGELVDGLTYVKAAEVIAMLRLVLGPEVFRAGTDLYFRRHHGGNADTDQFFACFAEVSGRDLAQFRREWLHTIGYPRVTATHQYDAAARRLTVVLHQTRVGPGGAFHVPVRLAAVAADGRDIPGTAGVFELTTPERVLTFDAVPQPAFLSYNRGASFYGTFADRSATPDTLRRQARLDPDIFNRVEAMRALTEQERLILLDNPGAVVSRAWLDAYREHLLAPALPDGLKAYLLQVDEQPLDRSHLPRVRECAAARRALLRAAAAHCQELVIGILERLDPHPAGALKLSAAIERRALQAAILELLVANDDPASHAALTRHLQAAVNITDRLNTIAAIWCSTHPDRLAILDEAYWLTHAHPGAYTGYLQIIGRSPQAGVFARLAGEEQRASFSLAHPSHGRALFVPLSLNNALIWTPAGLGWLRDTVVRLAPVNETTTLRLLAPCQQAHAFAADLREPVLAALRDMRASLDPAACPSVCGRLDAYLAPGS
jgi:aminopeptidase N